MQLYDELHRRWIERFALAKRKDMKLRRDLGLIDRDFDSEVPVREKTTIVRTAWILRRGRFMLRGSNFVRWFSEDLPRDGNANEQDQDNDNDSNSWFHIYLSLVGMAERA